MFYLDFSKALEKVPHQRILHKIDSHCSRGSKYFVGLKTLLLQGLSGPEFYGGLVYKLKKKNFSYHFKKIIVRYKKIGDNIHVLRQTACLVVNPIRLTALLISLIARRQVGI